MGEISGVAPETYRNRGPIAGAMTKKRKALIRESTETPRTMGVGIVHTTANGRADTLGYDPTEDLEALEALWMEKLAPFESNGHHRRPEPTS